MKAEHINPFIQTLENTVRNFCKEEIERTGAYLNRSPFATKGIAISIGITGQIEGYFVLTLSQSSAIHIVRKMTGNLNTKELDEMGKSAISELCNIIAGNACSILAQANINTEITPPLIVDGRANLKSPINTICLPYTLKNKGSEQETFIELNIAIKERAQVAS